MKIYKIYKYIKEIVDIVSLISLSLLRNRRVNWTISSEWTVLIECSHIPDNYFNSIKYDFDKKSRSARSGAWWFDHHDTVTDGITAAVHFRSLWYIPPGGFIKKDRFGEDRRSPIRSRRYALIIAWLRVLTMTTSTTGGVTWHRENGGPGPFNTDSCRQSLEEAEWDGIFSVGDKIVARRPKIAVKRCNIVF